MTKKLYSIKFVYPKTQPHRTEQKSELEYLWSNYVVMKDIKNSLTTFKNILTNKKILSIYTLLISKLHN